MRGAARPLESRSPGGGPRLAAPVTRRTPRTPSSGVPALVVASSRTDRRHHRGAASARGACQGNTGTCTTAVHQGQERIAPCRRDGEGVWLPGGTNGLTTPALPLPTDFAYETWFRSDSPNHVLMSIDLQPYGLVALAIDGTGGPVLAGLGTEFLHSSALAGSIADGAWHHVVMNAGNGSQAFWVDGTMLPGNAVNVPDNLTVTYHIGTGRRARPPACSRSTARSASRRSTAPCCRPRRSRSTVLRDGSAPIRRRSARPPRRRRPLRLRRRRPWSRPPPPTPPVRARRRPPRRRAPRSPRRPTSRSTTPRTTPRPRSRCSRAGSRPACVKRNAGAVGISGRFRRADHARIRRTCPDCRRTNGRELLGGVSSATPRRGRPERLITRGCAVASCTCGRATDRTCTGESRTAPGGRVSGARRPPPVRRSAGPAHRRRPASAAPGCPAPPSRPRPSPRRRPPAGPTSRAGAASSGTS